MIRAKLSPRANPLLSILLVLAMLAGTVAALVAFGVGYTPFGLSWATDAQACVETMEAPGQGLPEPSSAAERTWIPLGVICAVDLDGDGRPTVSAHQSWTATITVLAACVVVVLTVVWLLLGLRPPPRPRHP